MIDSVGDDLVPGSILALTYYFMIASDGRQYELFSIDGWILECSHRLDPGDDGTTVWLNESKNDLGLRAIYLVAKSFPNFRVPYWSIVVPLTLLSAWLLLSKSRRAQKPATTSRSVLRRRNPVSAFRFFLTNVTIYLMDLAARTDAKRQCDRLKDRISDSACTRVSGAAT